MMVLNEFLGSCKFLAKLCYCESTKLVKRATTILLATTMLGALTSQMVSSRVIHNLNANDSLTANVETFRHKRPAVMPENLNAGEYLSLAEHYISICNYKEAAKCIAKVKQLAPDSRLEESADQLEKKSIFY